MVVCKFFLQGTCKFGNTCRFEHDASGQSHGSSILRQPQSQASHEPDQTLLVKSVVTDNLAAEHGKQWMLSSYSPFKDKRPFPGFEDRSFEEIRYGFLEARNNGNLDQFKQEFNASYQDAMNRVKMLQNPSPNVADLIIQVYGAAPKHTETTDVSRSILSKGQAAGGFGQSPVFGGGQNSIFGGNQSVFGQTGNSIFGKNPGGASVFGQTPAGGVTNPIFGQNPGSSPFGQNSIFRPNANTAQSSIFGQSPSSVFGQNLSPGQSPPSVFGQTPNIGQNPNVGQNPSSVFGQNLSPAQNPSSVFGQNLSPGQNPTSVFGQNPNIGQNVNAVQNPSGVFGQNPSPGQQLSPGQNPSSIFGQNVINNQSVFAGNNSNVFAQNPSIFGNAAPTNNPGIFGQKPADNPQNSNVFGSSIFAQNQNKPAEQITQSQMPFGAPTVQMSPFANTQQSSIFRGPQGHSASIFGQNPNNKPEQAVPEMLEKLYSKLAELSVDDIKSFEAATFEFGKIPEVPPPYELCF